MENKEKNKSITYEVEIPSIKGKRYEAIDLEKEKEAIFNNAEADDNKLQIIANYKHIKLNMLRMLYPIIEEIANCLYFKLTAASVTLTNHLFETMVKITLAYADNKCRPIEKGCNFENYLEENLNKFIAANLGENIKRLKEFEIINENQEKRLYHLKNEYRNPFSHASNNEELKETKTLVLEGALSEVANLEDNEIHARNAKVTGNPHLLINARMGILKNNALVYFCEIISFLKLFDDKLTQMRKTNEKTNL